MNCPRCQNAEVKPGKRCPACDHEVDIGLLHADRYLMGRPAPPVDVPPVECPACFRGHIGADHKCDRCGIAVPSRVDTWPAGKRRMGRGPDRDFTSAAMDAAQYKEDHREEGK